MPRRPFAMSGVMPSKRSTCDCSSVGAVAADLDPAWEGTPESLAVARALYALPQVEAAIHTYSHPLDWRYYAPGASPTQRPAAVGPATI